MFKNETGSATINDVALEAGVSITTVSRVMNNNYPVKHDTRERVEKAIEKLNYKPNIIARGLIMKKTSVIGVIVPGLTNLFFPTIVEAVEKVTRSQGYTIFLNNTSGDAKLERELTNKMISLQVDGIIVIDPAAENLDTGFYVEASTELPIIIVNANSSRSDLNFVSYNEELGTLEAFEYLIGLGHEKITFLRGESSFSYDLKEKIYLNMLEKNKFKYKELVRVRHGNVKEGIAETEEKILKLLLSERRPTAIFACNDLMAIGVIGACGTAGLKVPEDISVIGFDNTLLSQISYPKITTVDLKMESVGKKAAEKMLNMINDEDSYKIKIVLDTSLVIRESCGKAKK
ncbi:LacI family DNA-binding transcriptional regulator [Pseudoneobacillus sp. C159]